MNQERPICTKEGVTTDDCHAYFGGHCMTGGGCMWREPQWLPHECTPAAPVLAWTKTLPTEKDVGKYFLVRIPGLKEATHLCGCYIKTSSRKKIKPLMLGTMPISYYTGEIEYEFLGPLPE